MNTDKIIAESIAKDYAPKEGSKLVALKKLDRRAKLPATIFTYSWGIVSALVFGTGMCLAMQVIGSGVGGLILGIVGGSLYVPYRIADGKNANCPFRISSSSSAVSFLSLSSHALRMLMGTPVRISMK